MVEKDLPVLLEYQVSLDLREQKAVMGFQEHQALKEDREKKETQDYRDFLVYQEKTVLMELEAHPDQKERRASQEHKVPQVLGE